eukprot:358583-Chlamydomonas_euryale.AAC.4
MFGADTAVDAAPVTGVAIATSARWPPCKPAAPPYGQPPPLSPWIPRLRLNLPLALDSLAGCAHWHGICVCDRHGLGGKAS